MFLKGAWKAPDICAARGVVHEEQRPEDLGARAYGAALTYNVYILVRIHVWDPLYLY